MELRTIYRRAGDGAVLMCPPHPDYGGSMYDVRLERISRKLVANGISTLRFDYRSVDSAVEDARTCFDWLRNRHSRVGVLGYSFGSTVAMHLCGDAMVFISPVESIPFDCGSPKLVVIAKRDQFVSLKRSLEIAKAIPEPKGISILDTDHLYTGKFDVLSEIVAKFFKTELV